MCYVRFMGRHSLLLAFLWGVLPAGVVRGEPFTVWEDSGVIYGRDEATGIVRRLSAQDYTGHSPDVEHHVAVWVDDYLYGPGDAIVGYTFDWWSFFPIRITPSTLKRSDPVVSWGGAGRNDYWFAWREQGGVWANYYGSLDDSLGFEVVADYTGPFSLNGNIFSYDGGQVTLEPPPPVPEPGTLALLAACLGSFVLWKRWHQ